MDCSWLETTPFDRRKAADELLRGRESAQQLRVLLRRSSSGAASQDLVSRILNSFSKTLFMLNRCESDDINGSIVDVDVDVNSPDARKPEESGDSSCKSSTADRRGCYKRRKNISQSWARESSRLVDDGHAWRKYGQKVILNAKYPRNYYRCTHKFDQGCQATKQVQRVEEDPPKFRTTYYGHHTCTNFLKASDIVLGSSDSCGVLLCFDSPASTDVLQLQNQVAVAQHRDSVSFSDDATPILVKKELMKDEEVGVAIAPARDEVSMCSPSHYITAHFSPDHLSEVIMGSVVDFEDDVLQFEF